MTKLDLSFTDRQKTSRSPADSESEEVLVDTKTVFLMSLLTFLKHLRLSHWTCSLSGRRAPTPVTNSGELVENGDALRAHAVNPSFQTGPVVCARS